MVGIVKFGTFFLCIGTTLANLNGLGNSALDMLRLKICVSAEEFGTDLVRSRGFRYI